MGVSISNGLMKFAWGTLASAMALMAYLMANKLYAKSFLTASAIIPALLLILAAKKRIPSGFIAFYTLATLFNVICMGWDLYNTVWHMDEIAHFFTSMALAPCLGHLALGDFKAELYQRPYLFFLISFSLTISVGAGWEILEYLLQVEAFYGDTMTDLIADSMGAFLGSIFVVKSFLKNHQDSHKEARVER